ncbi:MAG: sugar transferase [Bdellovibrionales bacterium]
MDLKRTFDVVVASAVGIVASPIILLTGALMTVAHGGQSPFFMQERVGKDGVCFQILKIKSMKDAFNESGALLPVQERTTTLGKFIRKAKLDELPQILNVLKGDMSIVGPRPLLTTQVGIADDPKRITIRPGIVGLQQISCGNNASYDEMLSLDHKYIEECSAQTPLKNLVYDLSIMTRTPLAILKNWKTPHYRNVVIPPRNDG